MNNIMKRAWEIYRTLTGDHIAKLSMALRKAWAEAKTTAKFGLVELKGSVKQIAWATDIRMVAVEKCVKKNPNEKFWAAFNSKNEAKWWIEHRYIITDYSARDIALAIADML